jgi:WD40 repeat protein
VQKNHVLVAVTCSDTLLFTAYADGLILSWECEMQIAPTQRHSDERTLEAQLYRPLVGHVNRINALEVDSTKHRLFSCSNDCTIR